METKIQKVYREIEYYIIVDNDDKRHFMNDRLAAQLTEERWKKEKELNKK